MTTLILTVAGADRPGLVAAVAQTVDAQGGNWENSRLSELAGVFAGVVEVTAPSDRIEGLTAALAAIEGLQVGVHAGADSEPAAALRAVSLTVLGNDRAGIVHEITGVLHGHGVSIDEIDTATRDAAMTGGRLFEATVTAEVPASTDLEALRADLERLTTELQVDITLT